jgi:hypothetical protein
MNMRSDHPHNPAARAGLIERLFADGIVRMGPSRHDPDKSVATLNPEKLASLAALGRPEAERFDWLIGNWRYENPVPATSLSPAYCDGGTATFARSEDGRWICAVTADGRRLPMITFDALSRTWIYVLTNGSYGLLRAAGWAGNQVVFTGLMTMIGIECNWRMTWTKTGDNEFGFVNEEQLADGSWAYIDEWRYWRI